VSRTTPAPRPGSDEINRAYEEGWVGDHGYQKSDGSWQPRALAFIGDTLTPAGVKAPELFIVDLPQEEAVWKQAFPGSETTMPAPPAGVTQRRLTFTHDRRYPGLATTPRHWVRSNPQGTAIAFLMKDDNGVAQLWLISPQGGEPRQVTHDAYGVGSAFSWHPSGEALGFMQRNRIVLCDVNSGEITPLTPPQTDAISADAVVISPDGRRIAWMQETDGLRQLWMTETGR